VWAVIAAIYGIILGMAVGAIPLLRSVFRPGVATDDRLTHLFWAVGLLAPLAYMIRYFIRVRLKTGRWRGTQEQRQQEKEQRLAKCSVNRAKRGGAANQNALFSYVVKWASYTAFQPTSTTAQRTAAWLVLVAYTLAVLGVFAIGLICFGASADNSNTLTATLLFIALGIAVLIWPGLVLRRLIRGVRAGQVGTTGEELDELRAQQAAWRMRESTKPLRTKLINTAVAAAIYAFWWLRVTVYHAHHPRESWVTPALATPFFLYSIWIQFRKPKSAPTATEN
jgi:hypothetical protein